MKKRVISLVLALALILMCCNLAYAAIGSPVAEPKSSAQVDGGLARITGSNYSLWGNIQGSAADYLSIRAVLYRVSSNGGLSYVDETSNSGQGPSVYASKTVSLSSGSYIVYLYGTTPTHAPSGTRSFTI